MPSLQPNPINPRVKRTNDHVLAVARTMLAELGPIELTYTALCAASGVTRQTLYRHWPTRQLLLRDIVISAPDALDPQPGTDPATEVFDFLVTLRGGMTSPFTASALMSLASYAPHDSTSAAALVAITDSRRATLNTMLSATRRQVDVAEFARLAGPVIFQCLIARTEVPDSFIRALVTDWLDLSGS